MDQSRTRDALPTFRRQGDEPSGVMDVVISRGVTALVKMSKVPGSMKFIVMLGAV